MSELIKGSLKQIIVDGDVPIDNHIRVTVHHVHNDAGAAKGAGGQGTDFVVDMEDIDPDPEQPKRQAEPEPVPAAQAQAIDFRALEELRDHYKREGEEYAQNLKRKAEVELAKAREEAENIRMVAESQRVEKLRALESDTKKALEKAKKDGFEIGYGEGMQKGTDDGYAEGLKKCKDALADLQSICDSMEQEKAALMAENRRGIFDMAMAVAEKITMTTLQQKDKSVLEKMITEAAKEFRSAKSVRVTLSRLDLSEDVEADLKLLEKCFNNTAQVEFEVLEDAENGTLLVETDSEILDAGVSTQLKMIEELGKGKFRDREPDTEEADDITEALKAERLKKSKKAEKPQAAQPEETAGEPVDVKAEPADAVTEPVNAAAETVEAAVAEETAAEPVIAEAEPVIAAEEPVKAEAEPVKAAAEPVKAAAAEQITIAAEEDAAAQEQEALPEQ